MPKQSPQLPREDFPALYRELAPRILQYLLRLCTNQDMAEGILQETFLAMYTHRTSFQGRCSPATWAYKIATNKLIDRRRNAWDKVNIDSQVLEATPCLNPSPEKQAIMNEDAQRLHNALKTLSEEQKTALILVRFEGMKYREAAEVLDVSLSTVRMRVYYGLLALKRSLGAFKNDG